MVNPARAAVNDVIWGRTADLQHMAMLGDSIRGGIVAVDAQSFGLSRLGVGMEFSRSFECHALDVPTWP
jgi:hypothetical protein